MDSEAISPGETGDVSESKRIPLAGVARLLVAVGVMVAGVIVEL